MQEIDTYMKTGFESKIAELAGEEQKKLWNSLKPIDLYMLEHYWEKVEGSKLDYTGCEFKDTDTARGKKTIKQNAEHGPKILVTDTNNIEICTKKNKQLHGFGLTIF